MYIIQETRTQQYTRKVLKTGERTRYVTPVLSVKHHEEEQHMGRCQAINKVVLVLYSINSKLFFYSPSIPCCPWPTCPLFASFYAYYDSGALRIKSYPPDLSLLLGYKYYWENSSLYY